ncbi:hypothetical protein LTR28_003942 [Elasticomyces elasticus]|nr:hypothetical protein LTR28_003942 [Elasticomyces elasticus]
MSLPLTPSTNASDEVCETGNIDVTDEASKNDVSEVQTSSLAFSKQLASPPARNEVRFSDGIQWFCYLSDDNFVVIHPARSDLQSVPKEFDNTHKSLTAL